MISLQKANFVTFKKPNLRKTTKTYAKYTKYDDVKQYEENVLSVFKDAESIEKINGRGVLAFQKGVVVSSSCC